MPFLRASPGRQASFLFPEAMRAPTPSNHSPARLDLEDTTNRER